ncbi:MAG: sigma-70 family RNA polymerase sigma factor [Acidobacteriaceae bacterium]|nr:sigma-70 family RNA polymerase sigma factor [Acidobacteriaceae bacterium]MBV9502770.1 sigma-70 family RNA polymerase sigma factor [Acidobacteriaceae bacterium]
MPNPVSPDDTDAHLLRLSESGNEAAFLALYRRHQAAVFRFAAHTCGRTEIAEEVVQDVFISLLSHPRAFQPERGSLEAYLIGMARNLVRRHLADMSSRDIEGNTLHCAETPLDLFSHDQELRALQRAILSLPVSYREVVVLCDIREIDYQAAARQLGCAVGTVRSRLHRARAILARKLRPRQVSGRGAGCAL